MEMTHFHFVPFVAFVFFHTSACCTNEPLQMLYSVLYSRCTNTSNFRKVYSQFDKIPALVKAGTRSITQNMPDCVFCKICNGQLPTEVIYKDNEYIVFPDIKPVAKHHYLVITKEHILNARQLTSEQRPIVEKLVELAKQVLSERGADLSDIRLGFHWPPFNTVQHLHLHAISPASSMSFIARQVFRPGTWWFVTPDYVLSRL